MKEVVFPRFITFVEKVLSDNGGEFLVGSEVTYCISFALIIHNTFVTKHLTEAKTRVAKDEHR